MDVSVQRKYADKSPFNIVDDSADPCKKVYHKFCKLKLGTKNLSLSLQLSPLGRRLGLLLVTRREGRASPVHVTETSGGHKIGGWGGGGLHVITCFLFDDRLYETYLNHSIKYLGTNQVAIVTGRERK